MPNNMAAVEETFNAVKKECTRSITKKDLHSDRHKEEALAKYLSRTFERYGENIAEKFQNLHQKQNPALSFLFAQLTNAIVEKTFHQGGCHAQAAYALIELAKKGIFNACLMCNKTGNLATTHYYLLILDEFTFERLKLADANSVYIRVNAKTGLPPKSHFFDTWSNELCEYEKFISKNDFTKDIKTTDQALFKPFSQLFPNEFNIIKNIFFCLNEYENHLKAIPQNKEAIPENIAKLFTPEDVQFQSEIELLFDSNMCVLKLLSAIEDYKKEFQQQLEQYAKDTPIIDKELSNTTLSFFNGTLPAQSQWKPYPENALGGKYLGHRVRFFTMSNISGKNAASFTNHLKQQGFNAELRKAKNGPSVVVDLTESKLTI